MGSKFIHGITWFLFLVAICAIKAKAISVDVVKFGAKGDGKTDDTKVTNNQLSIMILKLRFFSNKINFSFFIDQSNTIASFGE